MPGELAVLRSNNLHWHEHQREALPKTRKAGIAAAMDCQ
jgi:hypothetical protein